MNPQLMPAGAGGVPDTIYGTDADTGVVTTTGADGTLGATGNVADNAGFALSQAFGFFNIVVGIMIVAAFILFFGGLTGWITRLGLESRIDGLNAMYWGVTILFVLIILLGAVHYLQHNPTLVFSIIGLLILGLIAWAVVNSMSEGGDDKAKH